MLVDTHAHIQDQRFESDFLEVLDRARDQGVIHIAAIGIDLRSSLQVIELSKKHPLLLPVIGIHPNELSEAKQSDWEEIKHTAATETIYGIGETGLDRYWDKTPFEVQEKSFTEHLLLGKSLNKPVIIHCRDAEADMIRVLRKFAEKHGLIRGIMHSFCGTQEGAKCYLELGLHLSFAGMVTYPKNQDLRDLAKSIPDDRILVETDCPYLTPVPFRGKRNEPSYVRYTAACLAKSRNQSEEDFFRLTTANAKKVFNLS